MKKIPLNILSWKYLAFTARTGGTVSLCRYPAAWIVVRYKEMTLDIDNMSSLFNIITIKIKLKWEVSNK
jgi:hypothetical protein